MDYYRSKAHFEQYIDHLFNQGENRVEKFLNRRLPNLFYDIEVSYERFKVIVRVPKLSMDRIWKDIQQEAPDYQNWFLMKALEDEY